MYRLLCKNQKHYNNSSYGFNHQTVYRLLSHNSLLLSGLHKFQSPNGVQIALLWGRWNNTNIWSVSITKRCTDCFTWLRLEVSELLFQSPNGVQIALLPWGLQGLFGGCFNHQTVYRLLYWHILIMLCPKCVSITKRCTDCFLHAWLNAFVIHVSITKRCTDVWWLKHLDDFWSCC